MSDRQMIHVERLTKRYFGRAAVDGVSFNVNRGEIVGLLGPNGAGKTTIMRILSGFMPASEGTVRIAGHDVFRESNEVRRLIGYMPEHNPLHRDMRVREYLKFRARLKGLSRVRSRERVDVVMQQCGLTKVHRKLIAHLSKGFQQRVGLADALVHEPELIILDEPTIGLDPNQIRAVRQLIRDLGQNHTVLISTHILPEVEMTCTRVLILHQGRILAADTTENLQRMMSDRGQIIAEIDAPTEELCTAFEQMPGVEHFNLIPTDSNFVRCTLTAAAGDGDVRFKVFQLVRERNWALRELSQSRYSLEEIFVRVTHQNNEEEGF
jgi:ABC-2 type transport system ATP-binding protein